MTSLVAATFLLGAIFSTRVNGITTKTLPSVLNNSSDSAQFVQIRSALNQPTRAFLVQHKSALSPAQQTHILDDVQKNQRIHYSTDPNLFEDRQKSLFGGSLSSPAPHNRGKYSDFLNLNSLSPPPVQTVVLSPQQSLPTSPPQVDHLPYFRPATRTDTKPPYPHLYNVNTLSEFEPLKLGHDIRLGQDLVKKTPYYQSSVISPQSAKPYTDSSPVTAPTPKFPYFTQTDSSNVFTLNGYHDKGSESSTSASRSKPHHIKEANLILGSKGGEDKIIKEIVIKTNPEELIAKDRQKFFQQLLDNQSPDEQYEVASSDDQTPAQNDLSNIRSQFEKEFLRRFKENAASSAGPDLSGLIVNSSNAVSEFSLPNGQKIQISKDYNQLLQHDDGNNKIKAIVVKQPGGSDSSPAPSSNILEELTKGVVPPGVEYEVIKRNKDGALEEVGKLPPNIPQKKVTFVILEEQSDGTVRVQGVRGSAKESLQESGEEVETIIKKIKEGELKLPPSTKLSPKQAQKADEKRKPESEVKSKRKSPTPQPTTKHFVPTPAPTRPESSATESHSETSYKPYFTSPTAYTLPSTSSNGKYRIVPSTSSPSSTDLDQLDDSQRWSFSSPANTASFDPSSTPLSAISDNYGLFHLNNSGYITNLFTALKNPSVQLTPTDAANILQFPYLPSPSGATIVDSKAQNFSTLATKYPSTTAGSSHGGPSTQATTSNLANVYKSKRDRHVIRYTTKKPVVTKATTRKDNDEEESNVEELKSTNDLGEGNGTLSDVLKREGFFAMARFLRQSGLDTILNDTGPFTLFIPTDKAFRTLLIQLGGPDKAEEKFKENPRLLSGLLLHHVIPGAFRVNSLQDEMTGVSLAGTQLRVNAYTTHDIEWNDVTVITINGAKVLDDQKDIVIPQGIAHAIDRVMFPLPVGNLLQSLQADRENRYSNFLKVIEESELSYLLTGAKTFTLFAPLNRAFTHAEFTRIVSDANESKSFVLRHLVPGALYSAGMKYYQVRDSMEDGQQVTVYKEAGKIKVNSAHVITRNIPATNGVIHAIDAFL